MSHALTGHNRPQQVIKAIQQANASLSAAHRQAKYAKMAASPYRFFRGSNHLYWQDVWHDWRFALFGGWPNTQTWLQGDVWVLGLPLFVLVSLVTPATREEVVERFFRISAPRGLTRLGRRVS